MTITPDNLYFRVTSQEDVKIIEFFDRDSGDPVTADVAAEIQKLPEGIIAVPNFSNPAAIAYASQAQNIYSILTDAGFEEAPSNIFDATD